MDIVVSLKKIPFFKNLEEENCQEIAKKVSLHKFSKGQIIFKEGEPGDALYIIKSGQVGIYHTNVFQEDEEIAVLSDNSFFGEMALVSDSPRNASVKATVDTDVFILKKIDFYGIVAQNPDIANKIGYEFMYRLHDRARKDLSEQKTVSIIGVPMDLGQGRRGVDMGPSAIRYAGLHDRLGRLGYRLYDKGNIAVPVPEEASSEKGSGMKYLTQVASVNQILADVVEKAIKANEFPIILGGDHSLAAGSIVGIRRCYNRVGILWVDAHGDYNSPDTSPSGNLHGMPLGALLGHEPRQLAPYKNSDSKRIRPQEVVILGARDLDLRERHNLLEDGITVYPISDIDELGIAEVTRRILTQFNHLKLKHIHVSFDLDGLDPQIAPGVGTPVSGGLSYREAHLLMQLLAEDGRVVSLDIVELNPILDIRNTTAEIALELTASLLGETVI